MLESRSRQAGQHTFSYKHKVHKQVCLIIKIRRDRSRISKGRADVSSLMFFLWFAHILKKGFNFFLIIQRTVIISEQLH